MYSSTIDRSFLIVTGDFVPTGGMDRANYALADYIAREGHELHLVAHRVDPSLTDRSNVTIHQVPKPLDSYFLGAPLLARTGVEIARTLSQTQNLRAIVNGGNCPWADINWVHYVHAAYQAENQTSPLARVKKYLDRQSALRNERTALQKARVAIANSILTRNHLIDLLDLEPSNVKSIYYGTDPNTFYPATVEEKEALRVEYGWEIDRPIVTFIGALGDRRKGFDTLFAAWEQMCQDPNWQARSEERRVGKEC